MTGLEVVELDPLGEGSVGEKGQLGHGWNLACSLRSMPRNPPKGAYERLALCRCGGCRGWAAVGRKRALQGCACPVSGGKPGGEGQPMDRKVGLREQVLTRGKVQQWLFIPLTLSQVGTSSSGAQGSSYSIHFGFHSRNQAFTTSPCPRSSLNTPKSRRWEQEAHLGLWESL